MKDLSLPKSLCKQANGTTANCMDQHEAYAGSVVCNIDYRSMLKLDLSSYVFEISMMLILYFSVKILSAVQHSVKTGSRVLQADWLILENNEKATLNLYMPY